jgi:sortase A
MWNGLLLGVEILAMLGVLAVLVISVQAYLRLNQDLAEVDKVNATAQAVNAALAIRPTATPLITVNRVVLPGGHVWDANGQHRFNLLEVPEPYRLAFQEQLNAPRTELAAPVAGGPIRVQIPAIALDASVRAGDDWISLQAGVGHYPNSGKPGQKGNMVLTGHNDIFGEVFRRLEELNAGTEIRVQSTEGQWYTYVVREKQVVEPTEVWVLDQNLGAQVPLMTLITCHPYRVNTHRMIVFAEWVN